MPVSDLPLPEAGGVNDLKMPLNERGPPGAQACTQTVFCGRCTTQRLKA